MFTLALCFRKPVALSNIPCGHFGYRSCNKISYLNIITLWTLDLATEFAAICREFPYPKPYSLSSSYTIVFVLCSKMLCRKKMSRIAYSRNIHLLVRVMRNRVRTPLSRVRISSSGCVLNSSQTQTDSIYCNKFIDVLQKTCETKIEQKSGFLTVNRQCTQTESCMNNAIGNNPKCYPGENNVSKGKHSKFSNA